MSSPRASLIAVGVAAALGAAYWGWTAKLKPARDKKAADAKKPFAGLQADATQEVLLRKGSDEVLLRKVDGAWRLIKPVQAPADASAVEALVKALGEASREEIIAESGADLRQYGLDQPSGAVTFVPASAGAKAQVLFFGRDNPTGQYAYAMVDGSPQVFLLGQSVKASVLKDAGELRDKAVWRFDAPQVTALRSSAAGGFRLTRSGAGWAVNDEPGRGAAIEQWLGELAALKATAVPSEDGKGGAWGLSKGPHLSLRLQNGDMLELHAGASPDSDSYYAQGKPGTPVFKLPADSLLTLQKGPSDLADRRAFELDSAKVQRFEIVRPQGKLTALKADGAWAWVPAGSGRGKEFDFDGFISSFAGAELLKRLPKSAKPAKPAASVFFYADSGAVLEGVELGARQSGGVPAFSAQKQHTVLAADNLLDKLPPP